GAGGRSGVRRGCQRLGQGLGREDRRGAVAVLLRRRRQCGPERILDGRRGVHRRGGGRKLPAQLPPRRCGIRLRIAENGRDVMETTQPAWRAAVTLALWSFGATGGAAAQTVPAPVVDSAWLKADTATRTAEFELIVGLTGLNAGLNFNGF